jgi:hypothetical protein
MKKQKLPTEVIAYAGRKFTIEWYYDDRGFSQAAEYAEAMDESDRKNWRRC